MKNITTNKLQSDLSKVIKEVEAGEEYQVNRYSEPVAFLISFDRYQKLVENQDCRACASDLRKLAQEIKSSKRQETRDK